MAYHQHGEERQAHKNGGIQEQHRVAHMLQQPATMGVMVWAAMLAV